jgi:hypothetical protein
MIDKLEFIIALAREQHFGRAADREEYWLLTSSTSELGNRDQVTWAEVGKVPLCLLTTDMQNRRIIDGLLRKAAAAPMTVRRLIRSPS